MGAWGPGMQANDTALDAIENAKQLVAQYKIPLETYLEKYGIQPLLIASKEIDTTGNWGILGVAEWVIDNLPLGFLENSSIKYERLILDAINDELRSERLKHWVDPNEREQALLLFGKKVTVGLTDQQKALVEQYNQGLFDRIFSNLHER